MKKHRARRRRKCDPETSNTVCLSDGDFIWRSAQIILRGGTPRILGGLSKKPFRETNLPK